MPFHTFSSIYLSIYLKMLHSHQSSSYWLMTKNQCLIHHYGWLFSFTAYKTFSGYLNVKTVLFQTIQYSIRTQFKCQKQFFFKYITSAWVCCLNFKIFLFQTIQLSISPQFSSIWPMNRTLTCVTLPGRVDLGAMAMKGYSAFPKAPALLKPYHQIFRVMSRIFVRGVVPLCKDAVGVFYSWLGGYHYGDKKYYSRELTQNWTIQGK